MKALRIASEAVQSVVRTFARRRHLVIGLSAVFVSLPSLAAGLFDDDIWQRPFVLAHLSGLRTDGWWEMFSVSAPSAIPGLVYAGALPWWTSPHFQLSFFRPLSVATHYLDYGLWPQTTWLMHLQNTVWYALLCLAAFSVYRRVLGKGVVALLAAFLYAIDDAHLEAVAWIAARNSIVTAMFCMLTLVLLDEHARVRSRRHAFLAAFALSLAHLSSEGAIAVWPYILGNTLFSKRQSIRSTLVSLAPCAAVTIGFALLTSRLNYRVVGSGAYIDPRVRPIEFAHAVLERLPVLAAEQFGPPAWLSQLAQGSGYEKPYAIACVVGWLSVGAIAVRLVWRKRELHGLLVGALGSMLVACAARPEPRLLLMVGLGAHGLVAELLVAAWHRVSSNSGRQRGAAAFAVAWLALLHLALPPVASVTVPEWYRQRHAARVASAALMQVGPNDAEHVVAILNSPSYFDALSICTYRLALGPRAWRSLHILGTSERPVTVARRSQSSLVLETEGGYLVERTSQQARSPDESFVPGQTIPLDGLNVVVETTTRGGRPSRVRLDLAPEHDQRMRFLTWNAARQTFEQVAVPSGGERVQL